MRVKYKLQLVIDGVSYDFSGNYGSEATIKTIAEQIYKEIKGRLANIEPVFKKEVIVEKSNGSKKDTSTE